ncbi:PRC-barrel domain-containing protein [Actinomadura sp. BRA 177]|uniref:PRC-barrel domain-containing protein n=1 Tax=Actinomadura sp. BRA 177 TaxID=2745202 RepID=UPI001595E43E|nr:PRC-barrel domain-containing protein [Actinomadura sp. BRA 177]NVI92203.1 PRC-barrel domain-containing protein [Actinomadura sp. BRA 177]
MFEIEDIREWRGRTVIDESGSKIGELEAVYVDTLTDQPVFATVKTGMPMRQRLVFAPLDGATVGPEHLRVAREKKQIKNAPAIDTDGELLAGDEGAVFAHYDLAYEAAPDERRLARR